MSKLGRCANSLGERSSSSHAHLRDKPGMANWAGLGHCKRNTLKAVGADHVEGLHAVAIENVKRIPVLFDRDPSDGLLLAFLSADQNRALASRLTHVSSVLGFPVGLPVQRENVGKISISEEMR